MNRTRRGFLKTTAVGSAGLVLGAAAGSRSEADATGADADQKSSKTDVAPAEPTQGGSPDALSILMLGGTRFLGPAVVEEALARGHSVTLFNRGRSNPELFDGLEKLVGDRDPAKGAGLSPLEGRKWDAVVDTSGYFPRMVRASAELLGPNVGHYAFISSISVYASTSEPGMDESAPLGTMDDPTIEEFGDEFQYYGPLKALCEQAAEAAMPGRVSNIRPGLIVGYRDSVPRFTYWPVRVERGGEVLAPGSPNDPVQYIDVRDLAAFVVRSLERRAAGAFNANGPVDAPTSISEVLHGCKAVTGGSATFTWADADFLEAQEVRGWADMPLWVPPTGEYAGFHKVDVSRAKAAGLTTRPLAETAREALAWFHEWNEARDEPFTWRGGMEPEREAEVLAAWHARKSKKKAPAAEPAGAVR